MTGPIISRISFFLLIGLFTLILSCAPGGDSNDISIEATVKVEKL